MIGLKELKTKKILCNFMFIWFGIRLHILFAVGLFAEANISCNVLVSVSPIVVVFP